jgi:hypothetical protein
VDVEERFDRGTPGRTVDTADAGKFFDEYLPGLFVDRDGAGTPAAAGVQDGRDFLTGKSEERKAE